jgi:hypothetical protein
VAALGRRTLAVERALFQTRITGRGQDFIRWPMGLTEQLVYLAQDVAGSDDRPTAAQLAVRAELHAELVAALAAAEQVLRREVSRYNAMLVAHHLRPLTIPIR